MATSTQQVAQAVADSEQPRTSGRGVLRLLVAGLTALATVALFVLFLPLVALAYFCRWLDSHAGRQAAPKEFIAPRQPR